MQDDEIIHLMGKAKEPAENTTIDQSPSVDNTKNNNNINVPANNNVINNQQRPQLNIQSILQDAMQNPGIMQMASQLMGGNLNIGQNRPAEEEKKIELNPQKSNVKIKIIYF